MQRPVFSILINNYNYGRFVGRAIASALNQSANDTEVIVVDDGSSDESRSVLAGFRDRATIVLQENGGQAAAMNAAVAASRGEFLCFLDADDWWAPDKLSAVAAAFRADDRVSLVYHRLQPVIDESPVLKPIPRTLCSGNLSRRLAASAGWWPFPMTSAVSVRRRAWDEVGEIPRQFRISADAWLTGIYPFIGLVSGLSGTHGYYRIHNNNWFRTVDDAAMLRRRMAHWRATVDATNSFLAGRNVRFRVSLSDHYPYQVASAMLLETEARSRARLLFEGLSFGGEPNLPRRVRDALRAVLDLGRLSHPADTSKAAS